ncbi:integrase protein-related [Anaeramoeba ignava]|uniref:Integrase protein-related n=1 Tax=Anaeramoeba ignava TaxID=1746090 RepID=A0A9Q0RGD5_ANAIG|nr:integrase protein-related [Anaeramoeba ignava]
MDTKKIFNFQLNKTGNVYFPGYSYEPRVVIQVLLLLSENLICEIFKDKSHLTFAQMEEILCVGHSYIHKLNQKFVKNVAALFSEKVEMMVEEDFHYIFVEAIIKTTEEIIKNSHKTSNSKKKLTLTHEEFIKNEIKKQPSIYIREIQSKLNEEFSLDISISSLYKYITNQLKYSKKKLSLRSPRKFTEENKHFHAKFKEYMKEIFDLFGDNNVIFIDEVGVNLDSSYRKTGWGPKNEEILSPFIAKDEKHRINSICALSNNGFVCMDSYQDSINGVKFAQFMIEVLLPLLSESSAVVMDNCSIHHSVDNLVKGYYQEFNHLIIYLPPYSPELNPIEMGFGWLKRTLASYRKEFLENPFQTWQDLVQKFNSTQDAQCYFEKDYEFLKQK